MIGGFGLSLIFHRGDGCVKCHGIVSRGWQARYGLPNGWDRVTASDGMTRRYAPRNDGCGRGFVAVTGVTEVPLQ